MRCLEKSNSEKRKVEWWLSGPGGEGEMENQCFMGTISVWENANILEIVSGNGCTTLLMYLMPLHSTTENSESHKFYVTYILP